MLSFRFLEEACHKLMKVNLPPGQEPELPSTDCRVLLAEHLSKFFGLVGERSLPNFQQTVAGSLLEQAFANYYDTIHRFETGTTDIQRLLGHMPK